MRIAAALLLLGTTAFAGTFATPPSTTNNDDSCDIALQPAATLLLPYFEVDFNAPRATAVQTIFTIQNVSAVPQIANVTLWTDWGFPAYSFPVFLTGYDVQPINLYDVFTTGALPATSSKTTVPTNPTPGSQPLDNDANPNFLPGAVAACAAGPVLQPSLQHDLQLMFTAGTTSACANRVGGAHANAIGYATIDVVATCSPKNAGGNDYFATTILFDNTLTGDYQLLAPRAGQSYAQGGTLVHIRAVPEGGAAGTVVPTNLPYTFYDRYTKTDRRQPLPSAFVPRFIEGGTGGFNTSLKIWRETANAGACDAALAADVPFTEIVRFDEHENATAYGIPHYMVPSFFTPPTFSVDTSSALFPPRSTTGDVGGWLYLNLDSRAASRPSQNWVIASMFAEPTYAVELPATALGDGCSAAAPPSSVPSAAIGPAPNIAQSRGNPSAGPTTTNNDDSCDIAQLPAATLLLPYFEVDFTDPQQFATQTLFTIQNTSALPQIARVTLWTDWAYPAYSYPVFLGGYDVQPFSLYDLFAKGKVVTTSIDRPIPINPTSGTQPAENTANPNFFADARSGCRDVPAALPQSSLDEIRQMFTFGKAASGCQVGGVHPNAIGYITIDLVATCAPKNATSPDYFSIVLYDNVLTGDYQQLGQLAGKSYAHGGPLVHIRAIPEGGAAGAVVATSLPYTFYDRFTVGKASRTIDRRQPLPSIFAPRLIAGGTNGLDTTLKIWREGVTTWSSGCAEYAQNGSSPTVETVRFDEHENATVIGACPFECPVPPGPPATSAIRANNPFLPPPSTSGDAGGWLYLNLANFGSPAYSAARPGFGAPYAARASQAWVITSMFAEPTYAIETNAIALGNGCSPRVNASSFSPIGPAPNVTP